MRVRRATINGIETLCELRLVFFREFRTVGDERGEAVKAATAEYLRRQLPAEGLIVAVCEEAGGIISVGFLELNHRPPNDRNLSGFSGCFSNVYTLLASSDGQPLYEKLGFSVDGQPLMRRITGEAAP